MRLVPDVHGVIVSGEQRGLAAAVVVGSLVWRDAAAGVEAFAAFVDCLLEALR